MKMVEKTVISDVMAAALEAADIGGAGVEAGQKLVDVPTGKKFYLTGIYGVATVAGTIIVFDSEDGTDITNANTMLSLYISTTGDGMTELVIGPFSNDVYVASDTAVTAAAGRITAQGYLE